MLALSLSLPIALCAALETGLPPWRGIAAGPGSTYAITGDPLSGGATLSLRSDAGTANPIGQLVATYMVVDMRTDSLGLSAVVDSATAGAVFCARFEDATGRRTATGVIPPRRDRPPPPADSKAFYASLRVPEWAVVMRVGIQLPRGGRFDVSDFRIRTWKTRPYTFVDHSRLSAPVDSALDARAPVAKVIEALSRVEARFIELWYVVTGTLGLTGDRGAPPGPSPEPDSVLRRPGSPIRPLARSAVQHCHENDANISNPEQQFLIKSQAGRHAICPTWFLPTPNAQDIDESRDIDGYVAPRFMEYVKAERRTVLNALDRAAERFPGNDWIEGQRVRLLVDHRDTSSAVNAAAACRAERVWCAMLRGYVTHWRGDVLASDSIFTEAMRSAPPDARCRWGDVSLLLGAEDRKAYLAMPCAKRDSVHQVFWWLADPLLTQIGNARRAEHYYRAVVVALRSVVAEDGPYDWEPGNGGDAVRAMMMRYGPPSRRSPMSVDQAGERGHWGYLREQRPLHFGTNEYSFNRVATVASWSAVLDPFMARGDDWELSAKAAIGPQPWAAWWPYEHFVSGSPRPDVVQVAPLQSVVFRRDTAAMLVVAGLVADTVRPTARLDGVAVLSAAPGQLETFPVVIQGGRVAVYREMPPRAGVSGLEIPDPDRARTIRARFGYMPAGTLATVDSAHPALSDLAFLSPDSSHYTDFAGMVNAMLPVPDLPSRTRVGIYWETYGIAADTKVDIELTVRFVDDPGRIRRIATALGLLRSRVSTLTFRYNKALETNAIRIPNTRVPALGQSTVLDTRQLTPGNYVLTVIVRTPAGVTASTSKAFEIHPPRR
jgi:hypothetical protein